MTESNVIPHVDISLANTLNKKNQSIFEIVTGKDLPLYLLYQ